MNTMADPDPIVEIVEETEAWPLYPGEEEDFPGWEVKLREAQKQTHGKQKDANPTHSQTSVPPQYPAFDPDDSASGRESISGRVLDEVGRAVPGTAVTARLSRRYDLDLSVGGEFDQQETQADEEGHYAFRGLEEGEYEVRTAESRGYAEASIVTRTGVSSADLIVISQRRVWVYGAVENSRGEPLARVRVASLGQPPDEGTTDTDENGSYGLSLIVKGRNVPTRVHYYQEGYRLRSVSFTGAQFSREEDSLVVNVNDWLDAVLAGNEPPKPPKPELPAWAKPEGLAPDAEHPGETMAGDQFLGSPDAPLTVVEFSDFQCGACKRHALETQPVVMEKFVDPGKIRWVFKHRPLGQHAWAALAAVAAECAAEQNQFWPMHHLLFEKQEQWATAQAEQALPAIADELRLDRDRFVACFNGRKALERVVRDLYDAERVTRATPTFIAVYGGQGMVVQGVRKPDQFVSILEKVLQNAVSAEKDAVAARDAP